MARCIFEGLTMEQAICLADWYEGQGEQDAYVWFEENCPDPAPTTDVQRKGGFMEVKGDDVHVYCK